MKRRDFIYAVVMLLAFLPVTAVKCFDIHSDAKFHELYPDDEERAHREAAAAMEDCPFCNIQLSQFVVSSQCSLPAIPYTTLKESESEVVVQPILRSYSCCLRAPPVFS